MLLLVFWEGVLDGSRSRVLKCRRERCTSKQVAGLFLHLMWAQPLVEYHIGKPIPCTCHHHQVVNRERIIAAFSTQVRSLVYKGWQSTSGKSLCTPHWRRKSSRFPAQEKITGASKIPTIIYYDQTGNVRAVGAEAVREGIYDLAEEENWVKAEWYGAFHWDMLGS